MAQGCPQAQTLEESQCLWHRDLFSALLRDAACPRTFLTQLKQRCKPFPQNPLVWPSSSSADSLWCVQVSCMWDEILWLRQCVTVSQSSCSCILQTRFKMLLAISQMQVRVGLGGEQTLQVGRWRPSSLGSSMWM